MFGKRIQLCRLFGFPIRVDASFLIIAALVVWSLSANLFPLLHPELPAQLYWLLGMAGAAGLFGSVVLHELGHALMARRFGVEMAGITLFIFGGVAELTDEPPSPRAEFFIAVAGPAVSLVLAVAAFFAAMAPSFTTVVLLLVYLTWVNALLLLFNLIPAFPLDGGRVLRSLLWALKRDQLWATRISARIGSAFGWLLVGLGVLQLFFGNVVGAVWWSLIGMFVRYAARNSYQQQWMRHALEGQQVNRFMVSDVEAVPASTPLDQFVDQYVYRYRLNMYPAIEDGKLAGCVHTGKVSRYPREEWERHTVAEMLEPCSPENSVDIDEDASEALRRMSQSRTSRLMVVRQDQLLGTVTMRDLLSYLRLRLELERRPLAA